MGVNIDVDLDLSDFEKSVQAIEQRLNTIKETANLDIDLSEFHIDVQTVEQRLERLGEVIRVSLDLSAFERDVQLVERRLDSIGEDIKLNLDGSDLGNQEIELASESNTSRSNTNLLQDIRNTNINILRKISQGTFFDSDSFDLDNSVEPTTEDEAQTSILQDISNTAGSILNTLRKQGIARSLPDDPKVGSNPTFSQMQRWVGEQDGFDKDGRPVGQFDDDSLPLPDVNTSPAYDASSRNKGLPGSMDHDFLTRPRVKGITTSGAAFGGPDRDRGDVEGPKEAVKTYRKGKGAAYRFSRATDGLKDSFSQARSVFQRVKPSLGKIYAAIALILPIAITTAAEVVGLAAAIGGLGVAGGAAIGLGILGGEADTLAGSMEQASQKAKNLKQDLFEIIEPTADRLEPVTDAAIQETKAGVRDLLNNITGLRQAGMVIVSGIRPALSLIGSLFQTVLQYTPQIASILGGIGKFLQENASGFLEGVIEYAIKSIPKLKRLAAVFISLGRVIFAAASIASSFVSAFAFLAPLLNGIANIIGSKVFKGIAKLAGIISVVVGALVLFGSVLAFISQPLYSLGVITTYLSGTALAGFAASVKGAIVSIYGMLGPLTAMNVLLWSIAAALAVVTGGLLAIGAGAIGNALMPEMGVDQAGAGTGGGFGGGSNFGGRGGSGGSTTINVYGDVDNSTQESLRNKVEGVQGEQSGLRGNY